MGAVLLRSHERVPPRPRGWVSIFVGSPRSDWNGRQAVERGLREAQRHVDVEDTEGPRAGTGGWGTVGWVVGQPWRAWEVRELETQFRSLGIPATPLVFVIDEPSGILGTLWGALTGGALQDDERVQRALETAESGGQRIFDSSVKTLEAGGNVIEGAGDVLAAGGKSVQAGARSGNQLADLLGAVGLLGPLVLAGVGYFVWRTYIR